MKAHRRRSRGLWWSPHEILARIAYYLESASCRELKCCRGPYDLVLSLLLHGRHAMVDQNALNTPVFLETSIKRT